MSIRTYYTLAKPGIIYGNLFATIGGFFLAAGSSVPLTTLLATVIGLGAIIGSAGALNNYFDRDIDSKMERTKHRPSVTGAISDTAMVIYSAILGTVGTGTLFYFVNVTAASAAVFGWFGYIVLYTLLSKRDTVWGTFIGGFSGSMPPVVGYTAITGSIDAVAVVLFLMLFFWQMPHAYAITLFRLDDYRTAGIRVLPLARSIKRTKIEILCYALLYAVTAPLLFILNITGVLYLAVTTAITCYWLYVIKKYWSSADISIFGKKVFVTSLYVLLTSFILMGIDTTVG